MPTDLSADDGQDRRADVQRTLEQSRRLQEESRAAIEQFWLKVYEANQGLAIAWLNLDRLHHERHMARLTADPPDPQAGQ